MEGTHGLGGGQQQGHGRGSPDDEDSFVSILEPDYYLRRVLQGILSWALEGITLSSQDILRSYSSPLVRIRISVFDPAAAIWTALPITLLPYNWAYMATVVAGTDI